MSNKVENVIKDLSSFAKQIVARAKGDDVEALANKNERKARAAFNSQIAALESKIVDDQSAVEDTKEAYDNAIYPTEPITNNTFYIKSIVSAKEAVDNAEANLKSTEESLAFYKKLVKDRF